jgi:hypothetical protein
MKISQHNPESIEHLRKVMETEEGKEVSTDQVITRVLGFYKKFVPYN